MKLRLPHKFQAALMAALASVSFTTLSTGSTAYAATSSLEDAELKLVDFTAETMTKVGNEGWTLDVGGTDFAGDATGLYTTTSTIARIDSDHDWAGYQNYGGDRTLWAGIITIDVNSLKNPAIAKASLIQDASGTTSGTRLEGVGFGTSNSQKYIDGAWVNDPLWGETSSRLRIGTPLENYADANGLVTIAVIYTGDGTNSTRILVGDKTAVNGGLRGTLKKPNLPIFLADAAGVKYSSVYLFGLENKDELSVATMQSMMKDAGAYYWTGSANGNWNATDTNWTHYGSSVAVAIGTGGGNANTNVVFGADATEKNVTLAGATTVGALTVSGGDYTFNLNGNLTTSGITIAQGASLAYAGTGSISGALSGAGTFSLAANQKVLPGTVSLGSDWTGAVRISGSINDLDLRSTTHLYNDHSSVILDGWTGYFTNANEEISADVEIGAGGITLTNGWGANSITFTGALTGSGNINRNNNANVSPDLRFTGDVSGYTGSIVNSRNSSSHGLRLTYGGSANQIKAAEIKNTATGIITIDLQAADTVVDSVISRGSGTINITVGNGSNAYSTTFNKAVSASKLAVNNKATATLKETLTLTGDLTLDGSATLEKGGNVGVIDLSHSGNAHGTLTLAAGQNLTYSGSFWGANNNKLLLGEGATVKQASSAPIEIEGQAGESYVSSSDNVQFGLTASAYTLHNVKATIKTASDNVQLRFDNSKLVTDQTITLKNLQSVFSGMDIRGGTTTVGASDASGTVTLGAVTLSGGANLALADHVIGNVSSIDVTGTSAISGGTLSMGGTITTQAGSTLTLGGTVLFAEGGITNSGSGTLAFDDGVVFDLRQLTEGENHTYTLFTGDSTVDLTRFTDTANDHIAGVITTGRTWTFNDNGTVSYQILSRNLVWKMQETGTWSTEQADTPWNLGDDVTSSTYFADGDAVTFKDTEIGLATTATLGSDVSAASMTVEAGAVVTVNNGAESTYAFSADELDVAGTLTTNTDIAVRQVNISEGGVWNMGGNLTPASLDSYENAGTIKLLSGATMTAAATDTNLGMVTAEEGGTLIVSGSGAYTFAGPASDPFSGRLIYNLASSTGHDGSISLSNFDGTLEIRGRLNASASNFGGMTKLVLNGDRGGNTTTGLWNTAALTLNVPVDIVGAHQVDLYASANMIINGDINAGGAAGILGKRDGNGLYLNGNVNLLGLNIYANTVHLNGGAEKHYNLGAVTINGGNLAVDAAGVGSLSANDLIVISSSTLSSAAATPTEFNVNRFDVSNSGTNFTLQNVKLNVSGKAMAAELNTAQTNDQATVTVGDKATLNLNGGVVWNKADGAKTDYVNLTVNNGGEANVNAGTENVLNDVTLNNGTVNFGTGTTTSIEGALSVTGGTGTLSGDGTVNVSGSNAYSGGTLKLDGITLVGGADTAIAGNMEIHGGTLDGTMTLGTADTTIRVTDVFTVADDVNLHILGNIVLDDLASSSATYTGAEFGGDNGFLSGVSVKVFESNALEPEVVIEGAITYKGASGFMYAGVFTTNNPNYVTFIVNEMMDDHVETYSQAKSVGGDSFTKVELAAGTSFNVDSENAALTGVVVRNGETAASLAIGSTASIGSVTTGAGLTLTGSGTLTLGAAAADASLNGAGTLTINGPTVTINGTNNNSFTGNVDVVSGTLKLGDSTGDKFVLGAYNFAAGDTRTITVREGAVLDLNGYSDNNYVYTLAGGRLTNTGTAHGSDHSQTVGLILTADSYVGDSEHNSEFWLRQRSVVSGSPTTLSLNSYTLTKQGSGTFGLYNTTVTGTGAIEVQEGTLNVQGGSFGANLVLSGGNVTGGTLNLAKDITITASKDGTISAAIAGSNSITKEGAGRLELTNIGSHTGSFTVNQGELLITNNTLPANLAVTGAGELHMRSSQGTAPQNVALKTVSAANLHLDRDDNHNSRFDYSSDSSNLTGVQNLYFDGGQLWLDGKDMTGNKAFTGAVTFNETTYSENNVFDGAAIRVGGNGTFSGPVVVNADTKLAWHGDKMLEFSGSVTGDGNLNLARYSGTGTFKVSGDAAGYQGAITSDSHIALNVANQASLALGAGSNLAGAVTLDGNGTLAVNGNTTISGAVNGTGSLVVNSGATLTLGGAGLINVGTFTMNSGSYLDVSNITQMAGITVNLASYTDSVTCTAANITGVNSSLTYTLNTTGGNVTLTFASQPTPHPEPVADLGKVMYVGDSITDGVVGQKSWRYSFFQVLADGGIGQTEEGYYQHQQSSGAITTTTYGGRTFENNHSAQASARSWETAGVPTSEKGGDRYGYSSIQNWLGQSDTKRNGQAYTGAVYEDDTAPDTYFMLLGTNDLLSEGGDHVTEQHFSNVLASMFGYNGSTFDGTSGTFDKIWKSMTDAREGSKLIVMEMPTWSPNHGNHQNASDFAYMAKFNQKLHEWVDSQENKANITIVNPNPGLVDVANTSKPGAGVPGMYADNLHPNAQGELIIAGNIAQQLGYAGRSIGLDRANSSTEDTVWYTEPASITVTSEAQTFAAGEFHTLNGYTVDFGAAYGNGITGGWSASSNALSVQVGDGTHTGTLTFSEAYVMWGNTILYSRDNSQAGDNFRIAYVNQSVNASDNVSAGYYVWMGDMLIGEALSGVSDSFNGIKLTSTGANGTVTNLTWSDTAYAPTTDRYVNEAEAFHLVQIDPSFHDNAQHSSLDIDFTGATPVSNQQFATGGQPAEGKLLAEHTNFGNSWFGPAGHNHTDNIEVEYSGVTSSLNMFGVINAAVTGDVSTVIGGGSTFGKGEYSSSGQCSIIGAFQNNKTTSISGKLSIEINDATMTGHILMGTAAGTASFGATDLRINSGAVVNGNIFGGHHQSTGTTTGDSDITITGGTVNGTVYGGNMGAGTIGGDVNIRITGGIITGDVNGGGTGGTITGSTNVTVEGYQPFIGGNINAQNVTLKNVAPNGQDYEHGFDYYAGTINATNKLTLDNYTVGEMLATVNATRLDTINGTVTTINNMGPGAVAITVDETSSLTLGNVKLSTAISNDGSITFAGNVILDEMTATHTDASYEDGTVEGNGFFSSKSSVAVFTVEHVGNVDTDAANMTYKGAAGTYDATTGVFTTNEVAKDLTTFYIKSQAENLSTVTGVSADATVTMSDATRLVVDGTGTIFSTDKILLAEGASGATLEIGNGNTATAGSANKSLTLTGSGIYRLNNASRDMKGAQLHSSDWTGSVEVSGSMGDKYCSFDGLANANSTVLMSGAYFWWNPNNVSAQNANIRLNDAFKDNGQSGAANGSALQISGTNAGANYVFNGAFTGAGDFAYVNANSGDARNANFFLRGDLSGWTGDFVNYNGTTGTHPTLHLDGTGAVVLGGGIVQKSTGALNVNLGGNNSTSVTVNGDVAVEEGGTLNLTANKETTFNGSVEASNLTVSAGTTVTTKASLDVSGTTAVNQGGTLNIMNIAESTSLSVGDVTIGAGATMGVYTGSEISALNEADLVIASGKTLTAAGEGARVNANLVMEAGSSLDVSGTGGMGLLMGSDVTLNHGNILAVGSSDVDSYLREYFGGSTTKLYTLYQGTEADPLHLFIGDQAVTQDITFQSWDKPFMDASDIYTNLQSKTYYLVYDGSNVGMVAIGFVPEPTTSTLSLLALCALAARRRRK